MRVSKLFTKTSKNIPADETAKNAQLLIRAGYIHKEMAGVYTYLPLGKIVLDKIMNIIRQEMNKIGGVEISMTALQNSQPWKESGRWDDKVFDVWFKTKLANGSELGLAPTHEEPITNLMKNYISSYRDLPVYPYQFQIKFRNEPRSKSGLMRCREFWMKDLYSFSRDKVEHQEFYDKITNSYINIFKTIGIGDITYKTFASGGSFAKFSHEFQAVCPVGEDTIYLDKDKKIAINQEVYNDDVINELGLDKNKLEKTNAVEVGNIFTLGTKFSDALGLSYSDSDGSDKQVFMGSYGIGPSRLMGLVAECFSDQKGLIWPEAIAPYKVYLVAFGDDKVFDKADKVYKQLTGMGIEVLYDDRPDTRIGNKLSDGELIGLPYRVVVSNRHSGDDLYEVSKRSSGETNILTYNQLLDKLK